MTQEEYDLLLQRVTEFYVSIEECNNESREAKDYVNGIIQDLTDDADSILNRFDDIEEFFDELYDLSEWFDGGYKETMYPTVDEDDEEYYIEETDENDSIQKRTLDELKDFCLG